MLILFMTVLFLVLLLLVVVVVLVVLVVVIKGNDLESANGGDKDGRSASAGFKKRNTSLANVQ